MEKIDQILNLLEKKSLTESELKLLNDFSESDSEIKTFIETYRNFRKNLSESGHIHTDILTSYIMFEAGDDSGNKLIPFVKEKIKSHLNACVICREEYDLLKNEYTEVGKHIANCVTRDMSEEKDANNFSSFIPAFFRKSNYKFVYASVVVLILGYVALYSVSYLSTPYYEKNIFSDKESFSATRGRTSVLFQQGLNSIEKGDYKSAINFLNEDIHNNKNDKSIFYSHYIIGITYLKSAESDFIGLFKSFDKQDVELAISNLRESVDKNNSGDYENVKLDSYYYIGRAYMLLDDKESAASSFQKVISGKGKFAIESKKLIEQMEKND